MGEQEELSRLLLMLPHYWGLGGILHQQRGVYVGRVYAAG